METEVIIAHKDLYAWLVDILAKIDKESITDAFLYSLSSKNLLYRPYLACYVYASSIPTHEADVVVYPSGNIACKYCEHCETCPQNTEHLESELTNYGGVRVYQVLCAAYYLNKFLSLERLKPNKTDFDIFNSLIDTILLAAPEDKPRDLEKKFGQILKSNKAQREMLIDHLGVIGILETERYKGFHNKYTPPYFRKTPPVSKIDWAFPVSWWRGINKINFDTYNYFFGDYSELKKF